MVLVTTALHFSQAAPQVVQARKAIYYVEIVEQGGTDCKTWKIPRCNKGAQLQIEGRRERNMKLQKKKHDI